LGIILQTHQSEATCIAHHRDTHFHLKTLHLLVEFRIVYDQRNVFLLMSKR